MIQQLIQKSKSSTLTTTTYTMYVVITRKHEYNEEILRGNIFLVNLREYYYDFATKLNFIVKS